ncbi:hypothetical protein LR48_Vigan758s000300 [Vigna angularis]|uniref:Uncharacterized protein n=1 Tax=Phaseolus angularis TaxID=3914 RepID=A0A0L9TGW8_PHAAN|nr:hypothetical protein LR48_Vigan758s000300 [Vigna angularis]
MCKTVLRWHLTTHVDSLQAVEDEVNVAVEDEVNVAVEDEQVAVQEDEVNVEVEDEQVVVQEDVVAVQVEDEVNVQGMMKLTCRG